MDREKTARSISAFLEFAKSGEVRGAHRFRAITPEEKDLGRALMEFEKLPEEDRMRVASVIATSEDANFLWIASLRSAAFAVQSSDVAHLETAIRALVIDRDVLGAREVIAAMVVLHDAAIRLGRALSLAGVSEALGVATKQRRETIEQFFRDAFYRDKSLRRFGMELATINTLPWYRISVS